MNCVHASINFDTFAEDTMTAYVLRILRYLFIYLHAPFPPDVVRHRLHLLSKAGAFWMIHTNDQQGVAYDQVHIPEVLAGMLEEC